jgi:hypothetical protein
MNVTDLKQRLKDTKQALKSVKNTPSSCSSSKLLEKKHTSTSLYSLAVPLA